ncbi:Predicted ester cyclase [Caloramator quimbayensis]|uniref:Predicted ester cyclase n=1 Tax=Caloramator quimbayensis TaxID=1147123 RepID=A0A1T4XUZ3_9CLOT|nr:ester cyclase [Caloramator quimbayensis]SKA92861.1 Predicted ester cyclase [Caloramator quimbayensis]
MVSDNENAVKQKDIVKENFAESVIVYYGDSREVNTLRYKDYNDYIKYSEKKQDLQGFSKDYNDFVDYIIKITHKIWEEKGIGVIYDTYSNNIVMHLGSYNVSGINEVISGTLQTLHAFPDRRLIGQNVIWSSFDKHGYFSSHRIMSTATNLGDSSFGPATGKKINFRTTVDCAVEDNRIHEEWLVRDNLWIVKQLGFDPHEVAKRMAINSKIKHSNLQQHFGVCEAMEGQRSPKIYTAKNNSVGELVLEMTSRIYNYKLFNEVQKYYHENAVIHYICDKDLIGYDEIQGMLISLFASFPNASFSVERVTCNERDKKDEWDVAVRWRIKGLHEGIGYFGSPTGKPINILGINHYHISNMKVKEEWITFDGLDVLRQIYLNMQNNFEDDKPINE